MVSSPSSEASSSHNTTENGDVIIDIAAQGDITLQIEHESGSSKAVHAFRVSSPVLKANSKYFDRMLQPGRFGEAVDIEIKQNKVRQEYQSLAEAPSASLPVLNIKDIGRISAVKAVDALLKDFLYILHGKDIQPVLPVANLANLAIVADRFDALDVVKSYVRRKKMIWAQDGKTTPKIDSSLSEEKVRQRLLVAAMLDYPRWMEKYSARLIAKGWVGNEADTSSALWWDLPFQVEEELAYRRECVLDTLQSIQSYFLGMYASRERQCKLGYDSSAQCDSFQLGEMVRFFTRLGTLQFQGAILDTNEPPTAYDGDLHDLLERMRQVPEYQIDRFHTHCGIRTRILPLLDVMQECLQYIGICPECWHEDRGHYAWTETNRPLVWKRMGFRLKGQGHSNRHADLREMFMAAERDWS